jgi:hypothetical protein
VCSKWFALRFLLPELLVADLVFIAVFDTGTIVADVVVVCIVEGSSAVVAKSILRFLLIIVLLLLLLWPIF